MATAYDIIRRALRLATVLDADAAGEGSDFSDALDTLNALLAEMREAGIGLPDYQIANLTDELASDGADRDAVAYQLALRVSPEYGIQLSPQTVAMAVEAMARLRLRYFQPGTIESDLPRTFCAFNPVTG